MLGHSFDKVAAGQIDPRMADKVVGHLAAPASRLEAIHAD
jgi:hypothetical protein